MVRAVKKTHFGRAGEYYVMSELLLRGWNVAIPVVDVGDDAFIIDDRDKSSRRVQVKTANVSRDKKGSLQAQYSLSRAQLRSIQPTELYYVLLVRIEPRWRFLVIPRAELSALRDRQSEVKRPGRPMKSDRAKNSTEEGEQGEQGEQKGQDELTLKVVFDGEGATGWGASLTAWLDRWPDEIPNVEDGPGSSGGSS